MTPVPTACQTLGDTVATIETSEAAARAGLANLTGVDAWAALARLGDLRIKLSTAREALDACIRANSAAFQANLVIMDAAPSGAPSGSVPDRVAQLWELTPTGPVGREVSAVQGAQFSFAGPLPARLAITVSATGLAGVSGPACRSPATDPTSLAAPSPTRIEVVLGPEVRIEAAQLTAWVASAISPETHRLPLAGDMWVDASVTGAQAMLVDEGVRGTISGHVTIQSSIGFNQSGPFSVSLTMGLVPSAAPDAEICDLLAVSQPDIQVPGIPGQIVSLAMPVIGRWVTDLLTAQLRTIAHRELPAAFARALALAALPGDVTLSIRRLSIDPTAITFQPALGAFGTTLSTFRPPPIPNP
jgi:hypothetical protein